MQGQETKVATADEKIAQQAKTWRRAERKYIGEPTSKNQRAQYQELQKLRDRVDTLGGR